MDSKGDKHRNNGRSRTNKVVGQMNKKLGCLYRSHNEKGRFGTTYDYRKAGRKMRQGETERTNDGQSCCMDKLRKDKTCNFGS